MEQTRNGPVALLVRARAALTLRLWMVQSFEGGTAYPNAPGIITLWPAPGLNDTGLS
jgi:hypothetical protein